MFFLISQQMQEKGSILYQNWPIFVDPFLIIWKCEQSHLGLDDQDNDNNTENFSDEASLIAAVKSLSKF